MISPWIKKTVKLKNFSSNDFAIKSKKKETLNKVTFVCIGSKEISKKFEEVMQNALLGKFGEYKGV